MIICDKNNIEVFTKHVCDYWCSGRYGLMSRLFGSIESDEVRDFKLNQLDTRIQEGEVAVQERQIGLQ